MRRKIKRRIRKFRRYLKESDLFRWQRRQVALAVAVGLLLACFPIPLQFLYAGFLASLLRINVPVTIAMTTINNPFTFVPLNYLIYRVGTLFTGEKAGILKLPTLHWDLAHLSIAVEELKEWAMIFGKSYGAGLLIVSMTASLIGYFSVEAIWRFVAWYRRR